MRAREEKSFLLLVVIVSLAFFWILSPFYGAVLWATVLAILFIPLHRMLSRLMGQRDGPAALTTVLIIVFIVIVPLTLLMASLAQEVSNLYESIRSGEVNVGSYFQQIVNALPAWAVDLASRFGLTNAGALQSRLSAILLASSQFVAAQALNIGQNTFDFVISLFIMIYLLFFLLRDGDELAKRIRDAIPLVSEQKAALVSRFTVVIRATVKGNVIVAMLQGALGGLIFWFFGIEAPLLWAVLMAFLALLPAVGSALVWLPVAIYFLVTGAVWHGVILIAYGVLVIGLVDNLMRPRLVGKDTKMPDYVVLLSTLGGIAIFGINGFVIGPVVAAMFIAAWDIFATAGQPEPDSAA
jgi:predicted PurR-regulated permease PerM